MKTTSTKLVGRQLASAINSFATNEIKLFMALYALHGLSLAHRLGRNCFCLSWWCKLFTRNIDPKNNNSVVETAAMGDRRDLARIFYLLSKTFLFVRRQQVNKIQIWNISNSAVMLMKSSAATKLIKYELRLSVEEVPVGHAFLFISYVRHSESCTWSLRGTCFSAHSQMLPRGESEARQFFEQHRLFHMGK